VPIWLAAKEAMEYLRISKATFYRMVRDGRITAYQIAGTSEKRYQQEELDRLLTPIPKDQVGDE
jgi:excisionase family DNA binding protein